MGDMREQGQASAGRGDREEAAADRSIATWTESAMPEYDLLMALGIDVEIVVGLRHHRALFTGDTLVVDVNLTSDERDAVVCRVLAEVRC